MNATLKRCPFCNSHDLTLDVTEVTHSIRCFECGAMGPRSLTGPEHAVRYWNEGLEDCLLRSWGVDNGNRRAFSNRNDPKTMDI